MMDIQRLRNLTTGRLHTDIAHIYQDIEYITGAEGIMTHQLPNASAALRPYLESVVLDARFWDGIYDTTHVGEIELFPMSADELAVYWQRYSELPSLLEKLGGRI